MISVQNISNPELVAVLGNSFSNTTPQADYTLLPDNFSFIDGSRGMLLEIEILGSATLRGGDSSSEVPEPKTILLLLAGAWLFVSKKPLQLN
jgi:hypothetical protein